MVLLTLLLAFWFFLPAYLANPAAALLGGGTPMDFGVTLRDKRRLFGNGKTWRGFVGGGLAGVALGTLMWAAALPFPGTPFSYGPFPMFLGIVAALSFGALLGDLLGSFLKRRWGIPRGAKAPVLDQYDFVIGAFLVTGLAFPAWVAIHYLAGQAALGMALIIIVTPPLHRAINLLGHRLGMKEVPW
ncbi:MAG: CDP-2,3-bis-(O-geranylgeranyl)-sn-glycerol synthase, partial [Thermoplasmata archaeon]